MSRPIDTIAAILLHGLGDDDACDSDQVLLRAGMTRGAVATPTKNATTTRT